MYREADAPFVISAFSEKVFAIDRATGEIRWKASLGKLLSTVELAIDGGVIVAVSEYAIVFIDYLTGAVHKHIARDDKVGGRVVCLFDRDHVFLGGSTGTMACYRRDGEHVWTQPFKGEGEGAMALGVPGRVRQADAR